MLNPNQILRAINNFKLKMESKSYIRTRKFYYRTTKRAATWYDNFNTLTEDEQIEAFDLICKHQADFIRECITKKEKVIRVHGMGHFWINPIRSYLLDNGYKGVKLEQDAFRKIIYEAFGSNFKVNKLTGNIVIKDPFTELD